MDLKVKCKLCKTEDILTTSIIINNRCRKCLIGIVELIDKKGDDLENDEIHES